MILQYPKDLIPFCNKLPVIDFVEWLPLLSVSAQELEVVTEGADHAARKVLAGDLKHCRRRNGSDSSSPVRRDRGPRRPFTHKTEGLTEEVGGSSEGPAPSFCYMPLRLVDVCLALLMGLPLLLSPSDTRIFVLASTDPLARYRSAAYACPTHHCVRLASIWDCRGIVTYPWRLYMQLTGGITSRTEFDGWATYAFTMWKHETMPSGLLDSAAHQFL